MSRAIGGTLLNVAALGGLACIVLVLLAVALDVSLIMFKTGSMAPTIPAGSLAIVREVPAAEIRVGDVVTVSRPGELPITHRVTSVSGDGDVRTITMKGDANASEDPAPYTVTDVRIVIAAVPGLARAVVWFSDPRVLGCLTVAASALVTWAFWPRSGTSGGGAGHEDGSRADVPERRRRRRGRHAAALVLALLTASLFSGIVAPPADAEEGVASSPAGAADPVTVFSQGEYITLTSIGDEDSMAAMRPGVPETWQLGVSATAPEPGTVEVSLSATGSSSLGLVLDVRSCPVRWVDDECEGEESALIRPDVLALDAGDVPVLTMSESDEVWLLLTATVPESGSGTVVITVHASGTGDEASAGLPVGALPRTGADLGWAVLLGVLSVGGGLVVAAGAHAVAARRGRRAS